MRQALASPRLFRGIALVSAAVAVGLVMSTTAVRDRISTALGWVERPIVRQTDTAENAVELLFFSRRELADRIVRLEEQVRAIAQNAAQWGASQNELTQAYTLLDYRARSSQTVVVARVLFREREGKAIFVMIDRGVSDGIARGQAVVTGDGVLLGVVEEAMATSARVGLVTNAHTRIGVRRVQDRETIGVIDGSTEPYVRVRFVPSFIESRPNDVIVTSGIDPGIPANLVIGTVRETSDESSSSVHGTLLVEPAADLLHASLVGVLTAEAS